MPIEEQLDNILEDVKPVLDNVWTQLPERYKDLADRSFDNIVALAKQLVIARVQGDEAAVERTMKSLEHAVSALLSIVISGIVSLENPVREAVSTLALRALGTLITKLFGLAKA